MQELWFISLLLIWGQCLFNLLVSLLINRKLWSFSQNRSGPKVDLSRAKRNTSRANSPLLFRSREVHFWTRFWSSKEESCHLKTEENNAMVTKKEMETKTSAQIVSFLIDQKTRKYRHVISGSSTAVQVSFFNFKY